MKSSVIALSIASMLAAPIAASASVVDPNLIPDGQYVVKVERVDDSHHMLVLMQNGIETLLVGRTSVDFSKLRPNDTVRIALVKGLVPVFNSQ